MNDTKNNISSSFWNPNKVMTKVLLKVSETGIESTPGIVKHNQPITQSENPTDPTDAVTFKYLKENYTKENDPNPGFLPTTGGTMTGDIDMQGNNVTDIVMYKQNGQQDPDDGSAVTIGYLNEKADEIKSNDKITQAVADLSDINSQISTLHQLLGIAEDPDTVTNPDFLKTSGGTVYEDIDMGEKTVLNLGTPTNKDTKSAINVEFVQAKITSPQMAFLKNNDTNLSNITVSEYFNWLQDPTQAPTPEPDPDPEPEPEPDTSDSSGSGSENPADPAPTTPDNSNTPNNPPSPSNGASSFIRELAATTTGSTDTEITPAAEGTDLPNTTFSEKSPLWEEFFSFSDSSRSEIVIQKTGILTFSMQGTWNHPNNTTPTSTDPISLELTVTPPKTDTTPESPPSPPEAPAPEATPSPTNNNPTASITKTFSRKYNLSATPSPTPTTPTEPTTITKTLSLSSGQSCTLQIPVQATGSVLKLKYVNPNNNSSGGSSGSGGSSQPETPATTPDSSSSSPTSRIQIQYASTTTTDSEQPTTNPVEAQTDESTPPETTPTGITLTSFSWSLVLTSGEITKATSTTSTPSQP